jgi:hypothetical protein
MQVSGSNPLCLFQGVPSTNYGPSGPAAQIGLVVLGVPRSYMGALNEVRSSTTQAFRSMMVICQRHSNLVILLCRAVFRMGYH